MRLNKLLRGPLGAAFLCCCLISGAAIAAEPATSNGSSASNMLTEVEQLLVAHPKNPELHFIRGMALAELGLYLEAADEFRWMLTFNPSLLRPRLELARMLMLLKQYDSARYNFEQVLANELPEAVRQNILAILASIRERTPTLTMSFEIVSDSNPSQATSAEEIEIHGLRYRVNNDGRANRSTGVKVAFDGRAPLEESSLWFVRGNGEIQEFSARRFNFQYLQLAVGRHFHFPDQTLSVEAGGHASAYGNNPLYEGTIFGLSDYHQLRNDIGIKLRGTAQQLDYQDYQYLSGWQYGASAQGFYAPSSTRRWEATLGFLRNSANELPYSFLQMDVGGRYVQEWVGGWITGIGAYASDTKYEAADPIFLEERHDFDKRVEVELSNRRMRVWKFTPRLQIGWVDRHSNIDFYSYNRIYARVGMIGDF